MIVSSTIKDENGHAVVTFTDHLGQQYTTTMWVAGLSQAQLDAKLAAMAARLEQELAEGEADRVIV